MSLFSVLMTRKDCFLCKFYEWVESLFVREDTYRSNLSYDGADLAPFEHFTTYHSTLLSIGIPVLCAILITTYFLIMNSREKKKARDAIPISVCLYGFKTVSVSVKDDFYPDIPSREGYAFTGWFYDPSFTKPFIPGKKLKKDITLYPRWQKE